MDARRGSEQIGRRGSVQDAVWTSSHALRLALHRPIAGCARNAVNRPRIECGSNTNFGDDFERHGFRATSLRVLDLISCASQIKSIRFEPQCNIPFIANVLQTNASDMLFIKSSRFTK